MVSIKGTPDHCKDCIDSMNAELNTYSSLSSDEVVAQHLAKFGPPN
jgi:hypothetical protein